MAQVNLYTSDFKKFILRLIIPFVFTLGIFGYVFNLWFENNVIFTSKLSGASKVNRIIKQTYLDEIPIFGSSRAECNYIPDSLGNNFYNYGIGGTKGDVMLFFAKQECLKNKKTPLIITFDINGLSNRIWDIPIYIPNMGNQQVADLVGKENNFIYKIPFLKYFGYYEFYLKYAIMPKLEVTKFINKGSQIFKYSVSPKLFQELATEQAAKNQVFDNDSTLEKGFLQLFKAHPERTFIIVVPPYHNSCFKNFKNYSDAVSFLNFLKSLPNLKVFDFSKLSLDDSKFADTIHLTFEGAKIFNAALKDSLNASIEIKRFLKK